jgi:hypothetical protein
MALTASKPKSTYEPAPAGTHVARLYQIVHLGTSHFEYKGEQKSSDKIRLTFELCNETKVFNEGEEPKPLSVSREFGFTMGKKSHLRPFVEGMIGTALTDEEAYAFDIEQLLGDACLLSIVHEAGRDGNTYANIASASALIKGMEAPAIFNEPKLVDVNTATVEQIDALPGFLRDKIKASDEYKARFGDGSDIQLEPKDAIQDGDSPF